MVSTVAGAIVNIILDPIFIFVFKWGMMVAAVATVIGQVLTAALAVWYLCHMKAVRLSGKSFVLYPRLIGKFLSLGICSLLSQISLVAAMAAINNMIRKYGTLDPVFGQTQYAQIPMAVVGIVMKFFQIVISIAVGMAAGCIPVVGYNIGAGRKDRAKSLFTHLLVAEAVVGAAALLIAELLPNQLIAIFRESMNNRIITISREFGSGGRTIGRQAAERLGIPCYDQELIEKIAEESGLAKEYIQEKSEYAAHGNWFANAFTDRNAEGMSTQDYLWVVQSRVIQELAGKESCIIVGRCADYILRENEDCRKVFIHAGMKNRAERIVRVYGEREESPEKRLNDKDKRRCAYYQYYTDMKWGVAKNYHVSLDSGVLGIEKCVDIIASLM